MATKCRLPSTISLRSLCKEFKFRFNFKLFFSIQSSSPFSISVFSYSVLNVDCANTHTATTNAHNHQQLNHLITTPTTKPTTHNHHPRRISSNTSASKETLMSLLSLALMVRSGELVQAVVEEVLKVDRDRHHSLLVPLSTPLAFLLTVAEYYLKVGGC